MSIIEADLQADAPAQLAGRGRRLIGFLIDGLSFAIGALLTGLCRDAGQPALGVALGVFSMLTVIVLQVWLLAVRGQTIGKILLRMAIVDVDTKLPPGFLRASV